MIAFFLRLLHHLATRLRQFLHQQGRCALCRESLDGPLAICSGCLDRLTPAGNTQCRCGLSCSPEDAGQLCGRCLTRPPAHQACHCAWLYSFPLDRLVNRYKHHGDLSLEPLLLAIWLRQLQRIRIPEAALLVPIPVHWKRHWRRGFNQSLRLASGLGQALQLPVLPALAQPQAAPMLQGLSARTRRRQRHRFAVTQDVRGKQLILIDDVMTTGSTVNDAASVLLQAGAARVGVWTLCRVPQPD